MRVSADSIPVVKHIKARLNFVKDNYGTNLYNGLGKSTRKIDGGELWQWREC
jgi:hypothetical protein